MNDEDGESKRSRSSETEVGNSHKVPLGEKASSTMSFKLRIIKTRSLWRLFKT